jgi:hypothetical protein
MHTIGPPPQYLHVGIRPNPKKKPILNSPQTILFAIQHKIAKFLQNNKLQLVTLFSVCLRVLPFSEPPLKIPTTKNRTNSGQTLKIPPFLTVPLLRDPELILF